MYRRVRFPCAIAQAYSLVLAVLCGASIGCGGSKSPSTLQTPPVLQTISVSPADAQLALGLSRQFTASGLYSDGTTSDLTSQVTWSCSTPAVAKVTAGGQVSAVGTGSTLIRAALKSVSGSTTLQVTHAQLSTITVSPASSQVALGLSQQFTANGTFSGGTNADVTSQVTWSSSATAVAAVTGIGTAKAVGLGMAQIQARSGSVTGSATLEVTPAQLSTVTVSPRQGSIVLQGTQQFTATGNFTDGTQRNLTSTAAWNASPSTVASVNAGLASGLAVGTTNITAVSGSISGSGTLSVTTGLEKLAHIIFLVQENRSFDNYFGLLGQYRANEIPGTSPTDIDGAGNLNPPPALPNAASPSQAIQPYHFRTVCEDNLTAGWFPSHDDVKSGMKDFLINAANDSASTNDPDGDRPMGYFDQLDLPYYYELATQFATSDRMFSPVLGPTEINRMYLLAATSFGYYDVPIPTFFTNAPPTIFDSLDKAGISWRNYYHDNNHISLKAWPIYKTDSAKVVPIYTTNPDGSIADPIGQWKADLQNESTLPQVIFIERGGCSPNSAGTCTDIGVPGTDEHPGGNVQVGAADTASIINALMQSPAWPASVFILVYDEGGGTYDHVPAVAAVEPDNIPPTYPTEFNPNAQFNQTGFRVPAIIVSPWIRPHYVSHVVRDYTSILKLIEDRFGLKPLTARDASEDDMLELFDFTSPHLLQPPKTLPTQPDNALCNYADETP
jgi:phospholipase C